MERFLVVLALLFSLAAHGAQPSAVPSIGLGGGNTTATIVPACIYIDPANSLGWFTVNSGGDPTTNTATPLKKNGLDFQAGANGTACVCAYGQTSAANSPWQIIYSDAAITVSMAIASLTNGKFESGTTLIYPHTWYSLVPSSAGILFTFPANKYGGLQISTPSNTHVSMTCRDL